MSTHKVDCVTPDGVDDDYRLDGIGGANQDGTRWKMPIDKAIKGIDDGTWSFFTSVGGKRADIVVRTHSSSGRRYLTTKADGYVLNNLSSLKSC